MCFIRTVQNVEQTFNQINNMKNLKLFSVILMLLVGIGQVWAAVSGSIASSIAADDQVVLINTGGTAEFTGVNGSNVGTQAAYSTSTPAGTCILTVEAGKYGDGTFSFKMSDGKYLAYTTTATSSNNKLWAVTLASTPTDDQKKQVSWNISFNSSNEVTINNVYNTGRNLRFNSDRFCCYTSAQTAVKFFKVDTSNPTLTLAPASASVDATSVANQSITLTPDNFGSTINSVTTGLYSDAECNTAITSGEWVKDITVNAGKTAVTFNVDDNDGAQRQCWLKITVSDGTSNASAILPITQAKYSAPTGTFNKFTASTLTDGYYVICSGTSTTAMKNTALSGPRLGFATVSITDGKTITNPDESVVWKLENLTGDDAGYFTLYNEAEEVYAAFTSANGNANVIATVTDYAKFNHVENSSYEFQNKGKTGRNLRLNGSNGFANYATTTGDPLTLYKKAGTPKAVTIDDAIVNGSVSVTGAADLTAVAEGTELTLSNTPATGYKLTAYDVYKTGETATKITVTNNKFTMPDYAVTVSASFEVAKVLTGIEITNPATQTTFWQGETFNYDGLEVTAHFEGSADEVVTPASVTGSTATAGNAITVTVSYSEGGDPETTTYDIVVKALPITQETAGSVADLRDIYDKLGAQNNLYIKGTIYKINGFYSEKYISYWITDSYDSEAEPNHTNEFELYNGLDFDGADFSAATDLELGQYVIVKGNLTRFGTSAPYTYEFATGNQIVSRPKVLKSIAINDAQPKEFTQGDDFSSEGLIVTASYNYGDPAVVTPTSITGYNMSATGNQTVTVSYTEGGVTKTTTYQISVAAPSSCVHLATISKGAEENGTFELSVSGEQCLDLLEDFKTSTVLTATPAANYHLSEVTATHGTIGAISENSCTISNITESTTITAVFVENDKVTVKFAMGTTSATGDVPLDQADKYVGQSATLPGNPFTYTGSPMKVFGGWKHSETDVVYPAGSYTITVADAALDNITFTAVWNDLSPWATVYTSNVTMSYSGTGANEVVLINEEEYATKKAGSSNNPGTITVVVPAGTNTLHFHAFAWNTKSITIGMAGVENASQTTFALNANAGAANNSPYTLEGNPAVDHFYTVTFKAVEAETNIVFSKSGTTGDKRFFLFGVNAEYPAAITLDPVSKDFGEVKENASADFEFTITPNAMSTGDLSASIIGTDAAKFSVGAISENKVTVTFTPGEIGEFAAQLKIESDNAEVTAALTGTGIAATTPEIGIDKNAVAFGSVVQNSTPATQSVAVTLSHIDANGVNATITGSAFTISPENLTADGSIVITPVTTTPGVYSETLTLSANGADDKEITVTMTVVDQWAVTYTSNVELSDATESTVIIGEDSFDAMKAGTGSAAGSVNVAVPAQATTLHFHASGWKGATVTLNLTAPAGITITPASVNLTADDGATGSTNTYTLQNDPSTTAYFAVTLSGNTDAFTLNIANTGSKKQFVLYGVNQVGGVLPELQSIAIDGDMTNKTGYKAGDELDMTGLTVSATYTLAGTPQTPVDITNNPALTWTYDALVEDQTSVEVTANFGGKTDTKTITGLDPVASADPMITVDKSSVNFGSVTKDASAPENQTVTVTLTNVAAATATLGGTNPEAFSIDKEALTASGDITISILASTASVASYSATITISDDADAASAKVVNLSFAVTAPEDNLTGTWNLVTDAADLKPGVQVVITGVKNNNTFAMGAQATNNRTSVQGSLSGTVLTPAVGSKVFTLVATGEGKFALQGSDNKYLYAASSSANYLKSQDNIDDDAIWTISINAENEASIVAEESSNRNVMRFNQNGGNAPIFACYASASQTAIKLYANLVKISGETVDASTITNNTSVVVPDGTTLSSGADKTLRNVIIKEGGVMEATAGTLNVNDVTINSMAGKSGQLKGAIGTNVNVIGDLYMEIQMCSGELDADYWYIIAVPFDVNINDGISLADGTPMTNGVDYEVWIYDTQKRAQTTNGWKRANGKMEAGKAYFIGFNPGMPNTVRLKAAPGWKDHLFSGSSLALTETAEEASAGVHDNWNGIANPKMRYVGIDKENVQMYSNETHTFSAYTGTAYDFVVGTAFFVKSTGNVTIADGSHLQFLAPKRDAERKLGYEVRITPAEAAEFDNQIIVRASESANGEYNSNRDMLTLNEATSKSAALLWTENYGDKRLAIEEAPLVNSSASYVLGIYAPADGEYTISTPQAKEDVSLYLTRNGRVIWDLTAAPYTLDLTKGNTTGYGLRIVAAPKATTDLEDVQGDKVQCTKVLINNHVFILRGEKMYDVTGGLVK